MSVACTYSASGTHRALVRGLSIGHLHVRQQFPLVSGAPRDKLGMREPPAPGVPPRAVAALHPPRAGPRAHGPRCACVPVAGGGRLACSTRALPSAGQLVTAVPDAVTSCPATSCPALGIACALHGPRIRAGRGRALTPHAHGICRRARRPCFSSPARRRCDPSSLRPFPCSSSPAASSPAVTLQMLLKSNTQSRGQHQAHCRTSWHSMGILHDAGTRASVGAHSPPEIPLQLPVLETNAKL